MALKSMEKVINARFPLPAETNRLCNMARWDLYNGPLDAGQLEEDGFSYPGWSKAADLLQAWAEENLYEVWVCDDTDEVLTSEPEPGYTDEETGEWMETEWEFRHFSHRDVTRIILGSVVADHIYA